MGLAGIELVMAAEEEFNIHLPDELCSQISTVGEFYGLICRFLDEQKGEGCLTRSIFFKLRKAISSVNGDFKRIKPSTKLVDLLPEYQLKETLLEIEKKLQEHGYRLLGHRLHKNIGEYIQFILGVLLIFGGVYMLAYNIILSLCLFLVGLSFSLFWMGAVFKEPNFSRFLPKEVITVGDLTHFVISGHSVELSEEFKKCQNKDIFQRVREIVTEQLAVDMEDVTADADFFKDLGME